MNWSPFHILLLCQDHVFHQILNPSKRCSHVQAFTALSLSGAQSCLVFMTERVPGNVQATVKVRLVWDKAGLNKSRRISVVLPGRDFHLSKSRSLLNTVATGYAYKGWPTLCLLNHNHESLTKLHLSFKPSTSRPHSSSEER